jgi:hypothetical protein
MTVSSDAVQNGGRFAAAMINAAVAAMDPVHRMMEISLLLERTRRFVLDREEEYLVLGYRAGARFKKK